MKHLYLVVIVLGISLLLISSSFLRDRDTSSQQRNGVLGTMIMSEVYLLPVSPVFYREPLSRDLFRIVACENINWDVYARNPNSSAYGFCQIINGSWKYLEEKWDMKLDRDDPNDQLYACQRLLNEESFYPHWEAIRKCLEKLDN